MKRPLQRWRFVFYSIYQPRMEAMGGAVQLGKATVGWSSESDPAGASEPAAAAAAEDVYKMGLDNLRKMVGDRRRYKRIVPADE